MDREFEMRGKKYQFFSSGPLFTHHHHKARPPHRTLPTRFCQIVSKSISTQTLPVTECKTTSTEDVERDSLNLSSEFITPSLNVNGFYANKGVNF